MTAIDRASMEEETEAKTEAAAAVRRCFERLEGPWRLDRRILDRPRDIPWGAECDAGCEAGPGVAAATAPESASRLADMPAMRARLRGAARFQRLDGDTLAYTEEGMLELASGVRVRAVRRYVYRLAGSAVQVEFADGPDRGRRYLRFEIMTEGEPDARRGRAGRPDWQGVDQHLCGRDLYRAAYRFHGFGGAGAARRIVQRTTVEGPRKAYAIVTLLRAPGDPIDA
ncbi:DUF6314 family protein [Robbsia sp. Bb-Pol-6]|uniref:DUF6314 family protein n=1 Tax=Robbsia betulipollinis TaxID=2981849 RepID=A0ABT3ZUQ6_9BURK|nr:DUF6314 family protein [Robbsia betulipollinis]MCY0389630.1 DUF6314 family protein [Robbsia betulipollinis]